MLYVYNDGGRSAAGWKGKAGDCVCRAIAIATGKPYQEVYDAINLLGKSERKGKRKRGKSSARNGVFKETYCPYLKSLGWKFTPTMSIGSGCKVHLTDGELPEEGALIVVVSRHLTAVVNNIIYDTHDPQRATISCDDGVQTIRQRCVYGYFSKA